MADGPDRPDSARAQFLSRLASRLDLLRGKSRFRRLNDRAGIDLCSNDYLGLSNHAGIRQSLVQALNSDLPLGSTGSRLLHGNTSWHEELEAVLAQFAGTESALVFNSGYEANTGVFSTLCRRSDLVFADALIHASMIDGIRASGAEWISFPHNDLSVLESALARAAADRTKFLAVESVYSMDGDRAPLKALAELSRKYGALMIVDEAHATGVFGPKGNGLLADAGLSDAALAVIHTCGKAWGGFGAFVACPETVKTFLVNHCRQFIFTTALPPLQMTHLRAVLTVLEQEPWRRERVLALAARVRAALDGLADMGASDTQIIPILLGTDEDALALADRIRDAGFDVRAIRPPSVPKGSARLRLSFNAGLTDEEVDLFIEVCRAALRDLCSQPNRGGTRADS